MNSCITEFLTFKCVNESYYHLDCDDVATIHRKCNAENCCDGIPMRWYVLAFFNWSIGELTYFENVRNV